MTRVVHCEAKEDMSDVLGNFNKETWDAAYKARISTDREAKRR